MEVYIECIGCAEEYEKAELEKDGNRWVLKRGYCHACKSSK